MKKSKEKLIATLLIAISVISIGIDGFAHSGRTDANGGHKDNKNKSGLGSYHYHCGGHPAHLHTNGVCPYSSSSSSGRSSTSSSSSGGSSTSSSSSSSAATTTPSTIDVTEVKINENIDNLKAGESKTLTVTITPSNATNKNIIWKSNDESVATVSSTGMVVAKKAGIVEITATSSNGKTSTIKINIKEEPKTENNTVIKTLATTQNNTTSNTTTNNQEDSNPIGGILVLGLLGGGGYLGYKKFKKVDNLGNKN